MMNCTRQRTTHMKLIFVVATGLSGALQLHAYERRAPKELLDEGYMLFYMPIEKVKNRTRANALFRKVAAQREDLLAAANANSELGAMYRDGEGVTENENTSRTFFRKALSLYKKVIRENNNSQEVAKAHIELGYMYKYGEGVAEDTVQSQYHADQARSLYEQAANGSLNQELATKANLELGYIYKSDLQEPDYVTAIIYLKRVADQDAFIEQAIDACYEIAEIYKDNLVEQGSDQILHYLNRIISLADQAGMPKRAYVAHEMHGDIYFNGLWHYEFQIPKDYDRARIEYEKIPKMPEAQLNLGRIYYEGQAGVLPRDYARARNYFEQTIENDDAEDLQKMHARFYLGLLYYHGQGGAQNYAQARIYLEDALVSNQNNELLSLEDEVLADLCLGKMYAHGLGGAMARDQAIQHFNNVIENPAASHKQIKVAQIALSLMNQVPEHPKQRGSAKKGSMTEREL